MLAKLKELDKKKTSLIILGVLIVISIVLILSKMTAAYLEPDEDDITETNGVVTAAGDRLIFTKGNDISISANQDNFGTGDGNLTASTNPKATLIANTVTNSASTTYYAGIIINQNTFVKTGSNAELILTVKNPSGTTLTTSSDSLNYVTVNGVSGFDVTGKTGAFNIKTNQAISTTSTTTGTTQTWTFTLTFVNLSGDQSANETASFQGTVVLSEKRIEIPTYYWNAGFDSTYYSFPNTSTTAYSTLTELQSNYAQFSTKPIYIKTSTEHQTCMYYNNHEFCLGLDYWDTNGATTMNKLRTDMETALQTSANSCVNMSLSIKCTFGSITCFIDSAGEVDISTNSSHCRVYNENEAARCW